MPNTVVKLTNVESTWLEATREDRKPLIRKSTCDEHSAFFIYVKGFLSDRGTRDSVRTDLKERKRRTKRVSSMQKPVYEQFLKEQSDAQKAVSHCAALIESR